MVASDSVSSPTGRRSPTPKSQNNSGKKALASENSPTSAETDDPLLLSIASKQVTLVQQLITVTCYIPSSSVGAVIGRRGATIAQIQRQAQQVGTSNGPVRLSIVGHQNEIAAAGAAAIGDQVSPDGSLEQSQQSPTQVQQTQKPTTPTPLQSSVPYTYSELDWSSQLWTPVVIRADPCAALMAAQLLRDKVGQMDDIVMDVPLGRAKHAAVVGRRGYVLANLSADTNVRIMVPRRELRHDVIQLEGDLDKVKQCLERVLVIACDTAGGGKKKLGGATPANGAASNNTASSTNNNSGSQRQQEKNEDKAAPVVVTLSALPSQTKLRTVGRKTDKNSVARAKKKNLKKEKKRRGVKGCSEPA